MTKPVIKGNLEEMYDRVHEEKIKNENEEKKLEEMIFVKTMIIKELDEKYHFDRICTSLGKLNEFLPDLIDYIDNPNPKVKKSLTEKINKFVECMGDG